MILRYALSLLFLFLPITLLAQRSPKLTGEIIGTELSIDYTTNAQSTSVNTRACAFDGDFQTYFASYDRSLAWVGLDLGIPHVITGVAWAPRNDSNGPKNVQLAIFEGANRNDFTDAVPLYLVAEQGVVGKLSYADVAVTRAFRYVRYVSPADAQCNVAEIAFYGDSIEQSHTELEDSTVIEEQLYQLTNLPTVSIHVVDNKEPSSKKKELVAYVCVISRDGKKELFDTCSIRLRGNGSLDFPKKPYRIKFDQKHHVIGSPAKAKKWTLINNHDDKTLMRNILAFDLSRRVGMEYTPFCQPVDLILNGEYKGNYQLCDQIQVHKGRVEVEKMTRDDKEGDELTGGYLIEVDAYAYEEPCWFRSTHGNPVTIKYPESDSIIKAQKDYITTKFNSFENSLFASYFKNENAGYRHHFDLESFLRHFIVGEFSGNTDTYWSTYLYKHRSDNRLYVGPVWDFDLAFENDNRTYPICDNEDFVYVSDGSSAGKMRYLVDRIIKDDDKAFQRLKEIWAELRLSGAFDKDSLLNYVDKQSALLNASQRLNFTRWDIMNQSFSETPVIWGSYEAEVQNVRDYIVRRLAWMDNKLGFDTEQLGIEKIECETNGKTRYYDVMGRAVDSRIDHIKGRMIGRLCNKGGHTFFIVM